MSTRTQALSNDMSVQRTSTVTHKPDKEFQQVATQGTKSGFENIIDSLKDLAKHLKDEKSNDMAEAKEVSHPPVKERAAYNSTGPERPSYVSEKEATRALEVLEGAIAAMQTLVVYAIQDGEEETPTVKAMRYLLGMLERGKH